MKPTIPIFTVLLLGCILLATMFLKAGDSISVDKYGRFENNDSRKRAKTNEVYVWGGTAYTNKQEYFKAITTVKEPIKGFDEGFEKEIEKWEAMQRAISNTEPRWYSNLLYTGTMTFKVINITNVEIPSVITNMTTVNGHWLFQLSETERIIAPSDEGRTNIVNQLVTSGEVCKVRGHLWEAGRFDNTLLYSPDSYYRHCPICNAVQRRELTEWK